ncbi:MAG: DUF411 domain-containing protein [Bacteroidota bacterium]|nr:DUF411 domain-containing protein [Bacteroidota bacterium]MDE2833468.1 DUF411 domain-containing protein [Bacteroidota bacterium]MDE2958129.1 DUF411 domain-containing protein [Bacteroidota bacterium]
MKARTAILILTPCLVAAGILAASLRPSSAEMVVYKSATCGCCVKWIEHMEAAGFKVKAYDRTDMGTIKETYGVPHQGYSCHTAIAEGYVIEGHVPAEYVRKLLDDRPDVSGLTVPNMPIGSPGMEGPNPETYQVYSFDSRGVMNEYATVTP